MALYFIVFFFVLRLFSYKEHQDPDTSRSGSSNILTPGELLTLNQFRENVNDALYKEYMKSDVYLLRWLRVTDFNLDKAEAMLRKAMEWRQENNIDSIVEEVIIEQKQSPFYFVGQDYEGSTVIVSRTVLWDLRAQLLQRKRDANIRWVIQFYENMEIAVLTNSGIIGNRTRVGSAADKITYIADTYGYTLKQHGCVDCTGVYLEIMEILETYYPGYMKHVFFINVPKAYRPLLEMMKPIMDKKTRDVMQIFGSNKAEWGSAISKVMPLEQLQSAYRSPY